MTNRPVWAFGVAMTTCCTATLALGRQATTPAERVAAARAEAAMKATMPDTPGTGKFPAIKEEPASPPDYVVYHPADLGKLGLDLFGNGGCSNEGASSRIHLLEIASHGYLAKSVNGDPAALRFTIDGVPFKPFFETYGRHSVYVQVILK